MASDLPPAPARHPEERSRIPTHVAIVMDGNGRWAEARGLPRVAGHRAGVDAIRRTVAACRELGIRTLTLYAFSTENWQRSAEEVGALLSLLQESLVGESEELHRSGIRIRILGDLSATSEETRAEVVRVEELTANNRAMELNIAFNYGSRAEIARAVRQIAADVRDGRRSVEEIDEEIVAQALYTAGLPDPDLVIRTGGEQRLSNFLLWQAAYAELFFLDTHWPDFSSDHLRSVISQFQRRERRFGAAPGG